MTDIGCHFPKTDVPVKMPPVRAACDAMFWMVWP